MQISTAGISNKQKGFTLIELSIVVFLIALFSSMTIPLLTGFGQNQLDASARRLSGAIKYLYNESALNNSQYRLVFNLDKETWRAKIRQENGELVAAKRFGSPTPLRGDARIRDIHVSGKGSQNSGEVSLSIYPEGWIDRSVLHLDNGGNEILTLRIEPFTGTTEVYEGYREFE